MPDIIPTFVTLREIQLLEKTESVLVCHLSPDRNDRLIFECKEKPTVYVIRGDPTIWIHINKPYHLINPFSNREAIDRELAIRKPTWLKITTSVSGRKAEDYFIEFTHGFVLIHIITEDDRTKVSSGIPEELMKKVVELTIFNLKRLPEKDQREITPKFLAIFTLPNVEARNSALITFFREILIPLVPGEFKIPSPSESENLYADESFSSVLRFFSSVILSTETDNYYNKQILSSVKRILKNFDRKRIRERALKRYFHISDEDSKKISKKTVQVMVDLMVFNLKHLSEEELSTVRPKLQALLTLSDEGGRDRAIATYFRDCFMQLFPPSNKLEVPDHLYEVTNNIFAGDGDFYARALRFLSPETTPQLPRHTKQWLETFSQNKIHYPRNYDPKQRLEKAVKRFFHRYKIVDKQKQRELRKKFGVD